uniref:RING-type E3 ubiquitin transferase n=1 Tax=Leersia perrieri TaxID=77586 RepID=A0A0D9WFL2_9ORYZ
MSTVSPSPAMAAAAAADPSSHWAPHGPVLTACVVGLNLLVVALVFFYFWRFFSGKRGPSSPGGANDEESASSSADTSPATSPRASWRLRRGWPAAEEEADIAASLPVHVYSASDDAAAAGEDWKAAAAAECAVCIVEFRDGDMARLLPRCGHRFHADCVGSWLRLHSTCPLCRAAVLAPPNSTPATGATAAVTNNDEPKDAAATASDDCPV